MVSDGARRLSAAGYEVLVFPALTYTPAGFSAAFEGTVNMSEFAFAETLVSIGTSLVANGIGTLALANVHFDPENLSAIRAAISAMPDALTAVLRPHPQTMGASPGRGVESGALPRGCLRDLRRARRATGPRESGTCTRVAPVDVSLSDAMRAGKRRSSMPASSRRTAGLPPTRRGEGRQRSQSWADILFDSVVAGSYGRSQQQLRSTTNGR